MVAKKLLYFVSTVIAFALIVGTTVLCLAAVADPASDRAVEDRDLAAAHIVAASMPTGQ
jgi:hypothetical protein